MTTLKFDDSELEVMDYDYESAYHRHDGPYKVEKEGINTDIEFKVCTMHTIASAENNFWRFFKLEELPGRPEKWDRHLKMGMGFVGVPKDNVLYGVDIIKYIEDPYIRKMINILEIGYITKCCFIDRDNNEMNLNPDLWWFVMACPANIDPDNHILPTRGVERWIKAIKIINNAVKKNKKSIHTNLAFLLFSYGWVNYRLDLLSLKETYIKLFD